MEHADLIVKEASRRNNQKEQRKRISVSSFKQEEQYTSNIGTKMPVYTRKSDNLSSLISETISEFSLTRLNVPSMSNSKVFEINPLSSKSNYHPPPQKKKSEK